MVKIIVEFINMKKYCYIENNEVILANQDLPKVWKNVSGFDNLPDSILKTYGWLPLVIENGDKEIFISSHYIIEEDIVREIITTRDKSEQEIKEEEEKQLAARWESVRARRDHLLKESDLLVLIDRWETLTQEKKEKIKIYRQALRDLPNIYNNPEEIVWPEL
jgi:hypothetical protein